MRCPDCAAHPGQIHLSKCNEARCVYDGEQRVTHLGRQWHDCGKSVWTGEFPGTAECREYGLWCRWSGVFGYIPCDADDLGAVPDVHVLMEWGRWDQIHQRWVLDKVVAVKLQSG